MDFTVADGSNFQSGNLGSGPACFETQSRLAGGASSGFASGAEITVNGRVQPQNASFNTPLPPLRHNGYCIQTTGRNNRSASFSAH